MEPHEPWKIVNNLLCEWFRNAYKNYERALTHLILEISGFHLLLREPGTRHPQLLTPISKFLVKAGVIIMLVTVS